MRGLRGPPSGPRASPMREKQVAAERKDLVEIAARASLLQELLHEGSISREVYEKKSDELAQQREVAEKEQDELDVAGEGAKTVVVSVDDLSLIHI